jgi:hypothetical protein
LIRKIGAIRLILTFALLALLLSGCGAAQRAVVDVVEEAVSEGVEQAQEAVSPTEAASANPTDTPAKAEEAPTAPSTPTAPAAPTTAPEESEPEEGEADEPAIDPLEVTDFERLDSYRMTQMIRWQTEDEDGTDEGQMHMEIDFLREPRAMQWQVVESTDGDAESFGMIWLDGVVYMGSDDEWMAVASEEDMHDPWSMPPEQFVSSSSDRIGTETINGMRTVHYRDEDLDSMLMGLGHVTQADYWVSEEHDIVVRSIVVWTGKDEDGHDMHYEMQWDVTEINQPITITAPEGVAKPGLPDDVPLMAEATDVQSMSGFTGFEVDADVQEVTEYYLDALADQGWSLEEDMGVMLVFTKDGRNMTLMIDESGPPTKVTIMIEEE